MFGSNLRRLVLVAVMAAAVLSLSARESEAHWGRCWWKSYCNTPCVSVYRPVVYSPLIYRAWCYRPVYSCSRVSWGCYNPCARTCYASCGYRCYSSWRCGRCCYSSYYPWYSSCYSSCYSSYYGRAASCCGGGVVYGKPTYSAPATSIEPALADPPAEPSVLQPKDVEPTPLVEPPAEVVQPTGTTTLAVHVPVDARVYVNDTLTKTPGAHRRFISRGLANGYEYTYKVRAVVRRDGKELSDTRVVQVKAGQAANLAFNFDRASSNSVPTTLTLRVPEGAAVTLEGRETNAVGSVRQFTSTELAKGATWDNYNVVVTLQRDGRVETRKKTIDLIGGESRELTFDFGPARIAAR